MEKFTIPLQGNLDLDLLETPKMIKSYTSKAGGSLVGANFFEIDSSAIQKKKRLTVNNDHDRSSGFLPKIDKTSYRDSVESNGETLMSSVNRNTKGGNRHRKFEFVVPQHRMLKTEEKSENNKTEEENLLDLDNTQHIPGHYQGGTREVRVPHPFDTDVVPKEESVGERGSPGGENSLLGTHDMANAFTHVLNTMSSGGFKLPSIRR